MGLPVLLAQNPAAKRLPLLLSHFIIDKWAQTLCTASYKSRLPAP